jgi:hypothetical protein
MAPLDKKLPVKEPKAPDTTDARKGEWTPQPVKRAA